MLKYCDKQINQYTYQPTDKQIRGKHCKSRMPCDYFIANKTVAEIFPDKVREIKDSLYYLTKEKVRAKITNTGIRPDGRQLTEIRKIWCEAGVLPRVHGSGVFTRGQTQVMSTCTLGMLSDAQKLEGLDEVVVELIQVKTENENLRIKLNQMTKENFELKNSLEQFRPVGFGFFVK